MERRIEKYIERYGLSSIHDEKEQALLEEYEFSYFVNGFSYPRLPFITKEGLKFYEWGYLPSMVQDFSKIAEYRKKYTMLNAVGEEIFEKSSYKNAIRSRRGILPVSGFVEFMDINKIKYPHFIKVKDESLMSLACIYNEITDKNTGEIKNTFAIVTNNANPLMSRIHNLKKRMPLILSKEDEKDWLNPILPEERIRLLIKPFNENKMVAYSISTDANSGQRNRNREDIFEPVIYPELN